MLIRKTICKPGRTHTCPAAPACWHILRSDWETHVWWIIAWYFTIWMARSMPRYILLTSSLLSGRIRYRHAAMNWCVMTSYFVLYMSTTVMHLSLIHISEPTRLGMISYAVFC